MARMILRKTGVVLLTILKGLLHAASTTSGRKLGSVDKIAGYIAEMLALEIGPYFYIEYAGISSVNGTDFYEFRCYRA